MKKGAGKQKGSQFERDMCAKISLWISEGKRKDLLCRTVGSGGQYTFANTRGTTAGIAGDLRSQDPLSDAFCRAFTLEVKHWRDLEIIRFLLQQGELYKALNKVRREAEKEKKSFWLIAKQNNRKELLFMPVEAMADCQISENTKVRFHAIFNGTIYMYVLDDFLSAIRPSQLFPNRTANSIDPYDERKD